MFSFSDKLLLPWLPYTYKTFEVFVEFSFVNVAYATLLLLFSTCFKALLLQNIELMDAISTKRQLQYCMHCPLHCLSPCINSHKMKINWRHWLSSCMFFLLYSDWRVDCTGYWSSRRSSGGGPSQYFRWFWAGQELAFEFGSPNWICEGMPYTVSSPYILLIYHWLSFVC